VTDSERKEHQTFLSLANSTLNSKIFVLSRFRICYLPASLSTRNVNGSIKIHKIISLLFTNVELALGRIIGMKKDEITREEN
jgi:hypothetical protein